MPREEEIREIAYAIWEQEGCCDGRHVEHWLRAELIWQDRQASNQPATGKKAPGRGRRTQPVEKTKRRAPRKS